MSPRPTETEERLCAVSRGDLSVLTTSGLDQETYQLVQFAALVALDAPLVSWVAHLDAADASQLDLEKVLGTLEALAPIVGCLRVVSAGAKIVRAAGLAEPGNET